MEGIDPGQYTDNMARPQPRIPTFPLAKSQRKKPRRWPLTLRVIKSIHNAIIFPVLLHTIFAALVCLLHYRYGRKLGLPAPIIPSLSIVVGLMLVFRNQTSYNRFWDGRNHLTTVLTSVRNLTRSFLCCSYVDGEELTEVDQADIERTVRVLMAIPYAVKNHLRAEWLAPWDGEVTDGRGLSTSHASLTPEYADLLPAKLQECQERGLGLPLELTFFIENFIKRGHDRRWFHSPQASQLTVQLNELVVAFGKMETIRWTLLPSSILIHQRQVLALFGAVLPFALVNEVGWWSVPIVALVVFTLYGIDGIGNELEEPFGYDRMDIKFDDIVEDGRTEISVMLEEWRRCNSNPGQRSEMFIRHDQGRHREGVNGHG